MVHEISRYWHYSCFRFNLKQGLQRTKQKLRQTEFKQEYYNIFPWSKLSEKRKGNRIWLPGHHIWKNKQTKKNMMWLFVLLLSHFSGLHWNNKEKVNVQCLVFSFYNNSSLNFWDVLLSSVLKSPPVHKSCLPLQDLSYFCMLWSTATNHQSSLWCWPGHPLPLSYPYSSEQPVVEEEQHPVEMPLRHAGFGNRHTWKIASSQTYFSHSLYFLCWPGFTGDCCFLVLKLCRDDIVLAQILQYAVVMSAVHVSLRWRNWAIYYSGRI